MPNKEPMKTADHEGKQVNNQQFNKCMLEDSYYEPKSLFRYTRAQIHIKDVNFFLLVPNKKQAVNHSDPRKEASLVKACSNPQQCLLKIVEEFFLSIPRG